jgi:hypothetical protein
MFSKKYLLPVLAMVLCVTHLGAVESNNKDHFLLKKDTQEHLIQQNTEPGDARPKLITEDARPKLITENTRGNIDPQTLGFSQYDPVPKMEADDLEAFLHHQAREDAAEQDCVKATGDCFKAMGGCLQTTGDCFKSMGGCLKATGRGCLKALENCLKATGRGCLKALGCRPEEKSCTNCCCKCCEYFECTFLNMCLVMTVSIIGIQYLSWWSLGKYSE